MTGLLALLLVAAIAAPWLISRWGERAAYLLAAVPGGIFLWAGSHYPWAPGALVESRLAWAPTLGVEASFFVDGLSYVFALLITGIGALVLVYAAGYFRGKPGMGRIFGWLLFFLTAMLGVVVSDNLILLFVFWELTSVASFMLIGFKHEDAASREAARRALAVTGAGGLALLAGFLALGIIGRDAGLGATEAFTITGLMGIDITGHPLAPTALILVAAGALTKSAQTPFHFWLPGAMTAPTPVSAYLHSATMVKAGVFLLARLHPILGDLSLWTPVLVSAGGLTMLTGAVLCATQRDLKRILAYSTVSVLGILTLLLGLGTEYAIKAAVVFLVAHALYKAALFMVAGNVDLATGTRDVSRLGGLFRAMRWTAVAALFAALSKAGAPPLFGFLGKELLYKAKLAPDPLSSTLLVIAFVTNMVLVAMALVVAVLPFFGRRTEVTRQVRPLPVSMVLGPMVLAFLGIFIGLVPDAFDSGIGSAAATAIAGVPVEMKLKLWHGFNPEALAVVGVSALTLAAGFGIFLVIRRRVHHLPAVGERLGRLGPQRGFDGLLEGAIDLGRKLVASLLRLGLRGAVAAVVGTLLVTALPLLAAGVPAPAWSGDWRPEEVVLLAVIVGGALATLWCRSPLTSLASMGASGLGLALLFAVFGAPDLAMTQIMVEVLALIVLLFVLRRVRVRAAGPLRLGLLARVGGAIATGSVMAILTLSAAGGDAPADTAAFYLEKSYPEAKGRNVVNTILVDFRSLDTLGEVLVVAAAGLGVLVLLGSGRGARRRREGFVPSGGSAGGRKIVAPDGGGAGEAP